MKSGGYATIGHINKQVAIKDILKVLKILVTVMNVLPATVPHKQAIREIQLCEAYVRIYEMQHMTTTAQAEEAQRYQQSVQQLQHHFDNVTSATTARHDQSH